MKSHTAQNAEENSAHHEQSSAFIVGLIGIKANIRSAGLQAPRHSPPRPIHHQRGRVFAQDLSKPRLGLLAEVGGAFADGGLFLRCWAEWLTVVRAMLPDANVIRIG